MSMQYGNSSSEPGSARRVSDPGPTGRGVDTAGLVPPGETPCGRGRHLGNTAP